MSLSAGQTLSFYEILGPLGAGGMGEVWRARDTRLEREVAIKVLPEELAGDEERLRRFEREAKTLASLNHPSIAGIHGVDQAGDVYFLALELVPGEDLATRLARGPLPVDEAIDVCRQIAEGLETAHEAGVVHRDLKPANVRITPEGVVKLLDFGLAKPMRAKSASPGTSGATPDSFLLTEEGLVLGTPAYMSPEQARGKPVDRRTDVWAFGCVLFECLSGRRAFDGETFSDVLASVLQREPELSSLPAATPESVRRLLRRCLAKDPSLRLRSLGDARLELLETGAPAARGPAPRARVTLVGWAVAALVLTLWLLQLLTRAPETGGRAVTPVSLHAELVLPADAPLGFGVGTLGVDRRLLALSPDGRLLVYVGRDARGGSRLYRRDLSSFEPPQPIPGTEGAISATFSPDGQALAVLSFGRVERMSPDGDSRVTLCAASNVLCVQWEADGWIYVGTDQARFLERVREGGGELERVAVMPGRSQFLQLLPGGTHALVQEQAGISADFSDIQLYDLASGEVHTLVEKGYGALVDPAGRLVFARNGSLLAVPFDAGRGVVEGQPVTLLREVAMDTVIGMAQYAFSVSGSMAFVPGPELARGGIAWIDRDGTEGFLAVEQEIYGTLDLDPADRRIAVEVGDIEDFIRVIDVATGRVTRMPGHGARGPSWSSQGTWLGYNLDDWSQIRLESFDTTFASRVIELGEPTRLSGWAPDDRVIAATRVEAGMNRLGFLDVEQESWGGVIQGRGDWCGSFSPDGRWLAYCSQVTGNQEIFVRSYPDGNVVRQISDGGALEVVWCPSGELIYRKGDRWMSVAITTEPELEWAPAQLAFETDFIDTRGRSFDVSSDGRRLYVVKNPTPPDGSRIRLISNQVGEGVAATGAR